MFKKYNFLSKLDKVLLLFLVVNNEWSPLEAWKILISINKELHEDISRAKRASIYNLFLHVIVGALQVVIFPILYSLVLIIYFVVTVLTVISSLILIIPLAIFYGFFPFTLNNDEDINRVSSKVVMNFKGYHKLKAPIYRNWTLLIENSQLLYKTGFAPILKIKVLDRELETYIIKQIALALASLISMFFYSGLIFAVLDLILFIPLVLIASILGITWVVIHFAVTMIERLKENTNE